MACQSRLHRTCTTFADLLEYPALGLSDRARECASLVWSPEAASMMKSFASYSERHSLEHLQEVYTRTFDLQPSCSPYIGYQLFGEGHQRGYCLARLKERYRECNFSFANELPDHVAVMLRFLTRISDEEESKELIEFCFMPALSKMIESLAIDRNPYAQVLQALALTIRALHQTDLAAQTEA